jgi:hypothetical protein
MFADINHDHKADVCGRAVIRAGTFTVARSVSAGSAIAAPLVFGKKTIEHSLAVAEGCGFEAAKSGRKIDKPAFSGAVEDPSVPMTSNPFLSDIRAFALIDQDHIRADGKSQRNCGPFSRSQGNRARRHR